MVGEIFEIERSVTESEITKLKKFNFGDRPLFFMKLRPTHRNIFSFFLCDHKRFGQIFAEQGEALVGCPALVVGRPTQQPNCGLFGIVASASNSATLQYSRLY